MKILIVIPMNEDTGTILDVVNNIKKYSPETDYLVINGTEEFWVEARLINNKIPHIKTVFKMEHGHAFSVGIQHALENDYDAVIEYDSKGRFDARDIPYFVRTYENSDSSIVLGSRYLTPGRKQCKRSKWLSRTIKFTTGEKVTDPGLRFRMIGKKLMKEFDQNSWWKLGPDTVGYLIRNKIPYKEIQVNINSRKNLEYDDWKDSLHNTWTDIISMIFVQRFRKFGKKENYG